MIVRFIYVISRPCGIAETRLLRVGSTSVRVREIRIRRRFHRNMDFLDSRFPSIRGIQEMPIRRFSDCGGALFAPVVLRIPLKSCVFSVFSRLLGRKISPLWVRPFFFFRLPDTGMLRLADCWNPGFEVSWFLWRFVFLSRGFPAASSDPLFLPPTKDL